MRALAHPVRLAILDLLQDTDSATATECAREVGESAQTCSYHLRTLARYGFVARVDSADGRETRWELVRRTVELETTSASPGAVVAAATVLQRRLLERDARAVDDFLRHEPEFEEEWQSAAAFTSGSIVATADEVEALTRDVGKLLRRFAARKRKRGDMRRVHVVFRAVPRVEPKGHHHK
jgi:DNA-binding transcriptional ArsR family regulator